MFGVSVEQLDRTMEHLGKAPGDGVETLNCSVLAERRIVPGLFVLFTIVYWTYGNILFLYY